MGCTPLLLLLLLCLQDLLLAHHWCHVLPLLLDCC
jgi:hypothetical protein